MVAADAYFVQDDDGVFHPTDMARSGWGADMLSGPAVVSLAAWCLERDFDAAGFIPARLTTELFKAARRRPTTVTTRLVRDGRRIRNAECDIIQENAVVARAVMVQYQTSAPPPGSEWIAETDFGLRPPADGPVYLVGSDRSPWTAGAAGHQNTERKRVYHRVIDVVPGHVPSPFVRAVAAAEATSLVTNLGTEGIGYINGDLTVAMSRLPVGDHIGVQGDSHWCADGISVGTATLFDDIGPFGTGMVTAIANPAAQIDFSRSDFKDDFEV